MSEYLSSTPEGLKAESVSSQVQEILDMRRAGKSMEQIATEMQATPEKRIDVYNAVLHESGIKRGDK